MNYKTMAHFISVSLFGEAIFMLQGIAVCLYDGDTSVAMSFVVAIAITLIIAMILHFASSNSKKGFYAREGIVCVAVCWISMSILGSLPFVLSGQIPSFVDALFEIVSGFTTTGASIVTDIESMSRGLVYWRSFSNWIGGMGVLVFMIALMKAKGKNAGFALHLMRAESPGPQLEKLVPRIRESAAWIYILYIALTIITAFFLKLGGMSWFDTLCTTFSTAGTGGFGIKADGLGGYSPYIQNVCTVFMFLFGVNFGCYFLLIRGDVKSVVRDEELRLYVALVVIATAVISWNILPQFSSIRESIHHAAFQVSSIITTTGFSTVDFDKWPSLSKSILLLIMCTGACAGSTCGGMKCSRVLLLLKSLKRNISQSMFPQKVQVVTINNKVIDEKIIKGTQAYLSAYFIMIMLSTVLISIDGFSFATNFSSVLTCFNNIGPGLDLTGPASNFSYYSPFSKLVLTFDMLAGRLDIFPMLALFMRSTWGRY